MGDLDLNIGVLPEAYCAIDDMPVSKGAEGIKPVILQHQASREAHKNEIQTICDPTRGQEKSANK